MRIGYLANPASVHDLKWINHFSKQNDVSVFTIPGKFDQLDQKIHVYPLLPRTYPVLNFLKRSRVIRRLKKAIRLEDIQILHCIYGSPYAVWGHKSKFPNQIITTRGSDILVEYPHFGYANKRRTHHAAIHLRSFMEGAFQSAKFITSTSSIQQEVLREIVDDSTKLKLIRTGVAAKKFIQEIDLLEGEKSEMCTLFHPRFTLPLYRVELMIEALEILLTEDKDMKFRMRLIDYPGGSYLDEMKEIVKKKGLTEYVEWLGWLKPEEMLWQYASADIIVMTPLSDGTPVSGIEAMLAKKPLVLGNVKYDEAIFNNNTVWQMKSDAAEELASLLKQIRSSENHEVKMNTARETAMELADFDKEVQKLEKLYEKML